MCLPDKGNLMRQLLVFHFRHNITMFCEVTFATLFQLLELHLLMLLKSKLRCSSIFISLLISQDEYTPMCCCCMFSVNSFDLRISDPTLNDMTFMYFSSLFAFYYTQFLPPKLLMRRKPQLIVVVFILPERIFSGICSDIFRDKRRNCFIFVATVSSGRPIARVCC